jgi:hypothetical protein
VDRAWYRAAVLQRLRRAVLVVAYVALATALVAHLRHFYDARTRFTSLLTFGEEFQAHRLARLRDVPIFTYAQAEGFDGQFYAQLAVAGNPFDPELRHALDSAPYRSKRVLLPMVAHAAGLGNPAWVLGVYALANVICWLLLAVLLARWWFPPTELDNLLRWGGVLFGEGMLSSLRHGLTDAPALLVVAIGVRLFETQRRAAAAAVLAAAGLVRETSVLAAAVFLPAGRVPARDARRALIAAALCVAPAAIWSTVLYVHHGAGGGTRNFAVPLAGFVAKLRELADGWRAHGFDEATRTGVLTVVALATQVGFVIARPRPAQMWWRLAAAFALLWLCLGRTVWEGMPPAAGRVVLPLTLAFNVLVPRGRRGVVLLLAGNLSVLCAATVLRPPAGWSHVDFTRGITCTYERGWHAAERLERGTWRWAAGDAASLRLHNPTAEPVAVTLRFSVTSVVDRTVRVRASGREQTFALHEPSRRLPAVVGPIALRSGEDADVTFTTAEPAWVEAGGKGRRLTFAVEDLAAAVAGL